ncbi:hypothetical protein V5738_04835 [Salinisphaera sp. SPP-AMP-43]|uniref:hypothetical protein n=1 Tax=Salinisphaera sp. SPP-AMP-43 TaxID=3121288 RepID=UPI003C6E5B8A
MSWLQDQVTILRAKESLIEAFGVVLYTARDANIRKVLNDQDYWQAFDERSGENWAVIATRIWQGEYEFPSTPPDTLAMMVPIWREPSANKQILEEFGLEESKDTPCLLIFAEDEDGEILSTHVKLDDTSIESAYSSISNLLDALAASVAGIKKENYKSAVGSFSALSRATKDHKEWKLVRKYLPLARWASGFL